MRTGLVHEPAPSVVPMLVDRADLSSIAYPAVCNWQRGLDIKDPLGNDDAGDCFPVSVLRSAQIRLNGSGRAGLWRPTKPQAFSLYQAWGLGFNPADPSTFQVGTNSVAGMKHWCRDGVEIVPGLLDIVQWTRLVPSNVEQIKGAIYLTGTALFSLALPRAIVGAPEWTAVPTSDPLTAPGSYASHRVCSGRYDADGVYVVTWGLEIFMSWAFVAAYGLAADAVISWDWFDIAGKTPANLDRVQLAADRQLLLAA